MTLGIKKEQIVICGSDDASSTIETLRFKKFGKDYVALSVVNGILAGQPILIEYQIRIDSNWAVKEVEIKSGLGERDKIALKSDTKGFWYDADDQELTALKGCIDIDISITPFTNTLPIKRLGKILEQRTNISVLYFDIPNWEFKKVEQYYTKRTDNLYRYEGVFRNFMADLPIDGFGFITTYPTLFKRMYPKK